MRTFVLAALLLFPFLTASGQYVVAAREGYWACKYEDVMEAVKEAVRSGDQQAITGASVLLVAPSDRGDCFEFSKGDELRCLDSEILSGYTVVRKPGSLGRYYTSRGTLGRHEQGTIRPSRSRAPH